MSSIDISRAVQSVFAISSAAFKLAGSALSTSLSLGNNALKVYQAVNRSATKTINNLQPAVAIQQQALVIQQQALTLGREQGLTTQESIKVAALATANLYIAERPEAIQQAMQALSSNPTSAALATFTHQLAIEHQPLFLQNLSLSVQQASLTIGFTNIQTSVADDGALEIFARDDRSRNLVTVISAAIDSETTVATEVSGTSDSSCGQILDDFAKALAEVGVSASPPERKSTGGQCTLPATKKFVSSQPTKSKTAPTTQSKSFTPRRQVTKRQQNQQF